MSDRPIVLQSNRPADRFYRGGRQITEFRGEPPAGEHEPEDWIASTTLVRGREALGETVLPDGRTLRAAVEADPLGWLGASHTAAWGSDTKLLTKLLDAGQRLPVHAHPDGGFAAEYLGASHGKSEAWVVLRGGTVHLGLRREVGEEELRALVEGQRTAQLLELLRPIRLDVGDAVLVPAGQLHSIGAGVLVLEVQEPEDLSILLEWSGFEIDGVKEGHLGIGFDAALRAVSREPLEDAALESLVTRGNESGRVLPLEADSLFTVDRIPVDGEVGLATGYSVALVEDGEVVIDGRRLPRGATLVVPAGAGVVDVSGHGRLLVARPPRP